jgi:hypothetical protein
LDKEERTKDEYEKVDQAEGSDEVPEQIANDENS